MSTNNTVLYINTPEEVQFVGYTKDGTPIITKIDNKTDIYQLGSACCIGLVFGILLYIVLKLNMLPNLKSEAIKLLHAIFNSSKLTETDKLEALVHTTNAFIDRAENA